MAVDESASVYQGIGIIHPRWTPDDLWSAESSYTESGPRPGQAVPAQDTEMVLRPSGGMPTTTIEIKGNQAGRATPGGGGFVWRYEGETMWRGRDVPNLLTHWEPVEWVDGTGTPQSTHTPDVVALSDHTLIACAMTRVSSDERVSTYTRDPDTHTWGSRVEVYDSGAVTPDGLCPCMCVLPSDRVLLFHLLDDAATSGYQVQMHYSDDAGTTWQVGSRWCLPGLIDTSSVIGAGNAGYDIQRMRVAYTGGQILLMLGVIVHNSTPAIQATYLQYASSDLGSTFTLVEAGGTASVAPTYRMSWLDIEAVSGEFAVASGGDGQTAYLRRLSSAYEPYSAVLATSLGGDEVVEADGTGKYHVNGEVALVLDDDGALYLIAQAAARTGDPGFVRVSYDDGDTWESMGLGGGTSAGGVWWQANDAATHPRDWSAARCQGRIVVISNHDANPGDEDNSLSAWYLGGPSTVTMPPLDVFDRGSRRVNWIDTYVPLDLPGDVGWTVVGAGSESIRPDGALRVSTIAQQRYYEQTGRAGTTEEGVILRGAVKHGTGGTLTANDIGIRLEVADGAIQYLVEIRVDATGFRVVDLLGAPTTLVTVATDTTTTGVELLFALSGSDAWRQVAIWYRSRSSDPDRAWTLAVQSSAISSGAAGTIDITWGVGIAGATTAIADWWEFHFADDQFVGAPHPLQGQLAGGQSNPDEVFSRGFSRLPVWVDGGMLLTSVDGPVYIEDDWTVTPEYDWPIRAIFPSAEPSPRIGWRSTGTTVARVAVQMGVATAENTSDSDVIALYLAECNWRLGKLQGYDQGTTTWIDLAVIDMATDLSGLPYTRHGETIVPSGVGHTQDRYIHYGELVGATVDLGGGTYRRIAANTEGLWTDATTRRPVITLEGALAGDPGSGTCHIWSRRAVVIRSLAGVTYEGYRLQVDSQSNVDGYFEIGTAALVSVAVFGRRASIGRITGSEPQVLLSETESRIRRARQLAPSARFAEFAWLDGLDLTQLQESTPTGDYVLGSTTGGSEPVALSRDGPMMLRDVIATIPGQVRPVLYLPAVPQGPPDTVIYTDPDRYLYGLVVSSGRLEVYIGDEQSDEVVRMPAIRIEEEV